MDKITNQLRQAKKLASLHCAAPRNRFSLGALFSSGSSC
jgi:hypothetical protein